MEEHIIKLEKLTKSYRKKPVLQDVSLQVPKGCIFGLLGPSGCGKTTTVKIVAGILKADSGKAVILGKEMPNLQLMSEIGYMGQESALYESLSAYENLMFFGKIYKLNKKEIEKQIAYIAQLLNLQDDLKKKVCDYSGGMKRRLAMMREGQILAAGTPEETIKVSGQSDMESAFIYYSGRKQSRTGGSEYES